MGISVARALQELKRTDDKINRAIEGGAFIGMMVGGKDVMGSGLSKDDMSKNFRANMDKVNDLIKHRAKLKSAIVQSNATTKVTLPLFGETTVAQAIEYKSLVSSQKSLVDHMSRQYRESIKMMNMQNKKNEERVAQLVEAALGSDSKKTGEEYESIAKPYMERYKVDIVDPLSLKELIDKKTEELEDFASNIDYILSEINAVTMIEA